MTNLFNLFCPFVRKHLEVSVFLLILVRFFFSLLIEEAFLLKRNFFFKVKILDSLFPSTYKIQVFLFWGFFLLVLMNVISLVGFSYPVTTTCAFNIRLASIIWVRRVIFIFYKAAPFSALIPSGSPNYLAPFLGLVELVRILVRPVTLCFRLLANIRAGHILLALICKLPFNIWLFGSLFRVLEILVCMVQAFVFLILVRVYVEESLRHFLISFWNITLKKLKKAVEKTWNFTYRGSFSLGLEYLLEMIKKIISNCASWSSNCFNYSNVILLVWIIYIFYYFNLFFFC